MSATEVTTRYATNVNTIPEAWTFIMAQLDNLGPAPSIHITPVWTVDSDNDTTFDVSVEGTTQL